MPEFSYKRSVRYYHFYPVQKDSKGSKIDASIAAPPRWKERLSEAFKDVKSGLLIPDDKSKIRYYLHEHTGNQSLVQISMHSKMDLAFSTEIDDSSPSPNDFKLLDPEGSRYLAKATSVTLGLMDDRLVAAVATGMQGAAPGVKALHRFINYAIKLNDSSWSWEQHGVLLESDRKLLKASDGARAFSGEFISGDLLVGKSKDPISKSLRKMSRQTGVEIRGYVRYEIVDKDSRIGIDKFRDITAKLPFGKGVKPKVTAVDGSGERILTLASHNFASEIYLKPNDLIGANFSSLLNLTMENFESVTPEITEVISTFYPKARGKKWTGQKTESSSTGKQSTLF